MTTAVQSPPRSATRPPAYLILEGISWETYRRLSQELGNRPIRKAYNRGVLELMSPGPYHETNKRRFGRFIETVTEELEIPSVSLASTTWDRPAFERGLEADECYYLTAEKIAALPAKLPDSADDLLAPDLAVEIDRRDPRIDRPEIYATLGVAEVWRFDARGLHIDRLRPDGSGYDPATTSLFLPIDPAEVTLWVTDPEPNETAWARRLRAWVRETVVPRRRGE